MQYFFFDKIFLDSQNPSLTCPDGIFVGGETEDRELLLESDGQISALGSQNLQSDSVISLSTSGETHIGANKQNPKFKQSPPHNDNKSSFSSSVWHTSLFILSTNLALISLQWV